MKKIRVLIAEDDYIVSKDIQRSLNKDKYEIVDFASNGVQAIEKCLYHKPDVILMDIKMPVLSGLNACEQIKKKCSTPIVILTAHENIKFVEKASKQGALSFLLKPPKSVELDNSIRLAIDRHQDIKKLNKLNKELKKELEQRKEAEKKLLNSKKEYEEILENSKDAIIIRKGHKILFVNKAFSKLLNCPRSNIMERSYYNLVNSIKHIEKKSNENPFSTYFKQQNGDKIFIEYTEKDVTYNSQRVKFSIIHNVTKQKKLMDLLDKEENQTKGLKEFIPICASCNNIRDDEKEKDKWTKPADYITQRLPKVNFTHTICPKCSKKLYGKYAFEPE